MVEVYGDNTNLIPEDMPELIPYMDEAMPKEAVHMEIIIMDHFELVSQYAPTGDQPQAIEELVKGFKEGNQFQILLGVTGSGKTFTMANYI